MSPLFQKMSDCETDCAALNLSSCTLVDHTLADPHLLLLSKVEVDTDGCFNEAAYLAQVVSQHSPVFVGQQTFGQEDNLSSRHFVRVACRPCTFCQEYACQAWTSCQDGFMSVEVVRSEMSHPTGSNILVAPMFHTALNPPILIQPDQ